MRVDLRTRGFAVLRSQRCLRQHRSERRHDPMRVHARIDLGMQRHRRRWRLRSERMWSDGRAVLWSGVGVWNRGWRRTWNQLLLHACRILGL
jgi:hypothetical protein